MNSQYPWAVNHNKLQRSLLAVKTGNEDEIKAHYVSLGGLLNLEVKTETPEAVAVEVVLEETKEDAFEPQVVEVPEVETKKAKK